MVEQNFTIDNLEAEIREVVETRAPVEVPQPSDYAPRMPLPTYVTPSDDVPQAGRLTAEVVVQQYEQTARDIEAMAADLIGLQKRADQEIASVHRVIQELRETAQLARDHGKTAFETIEGMAKVTSQVSEACAEIRLKLVPQ